MKRIVNLILVLLTAGSIFASTPDEPIKAVQIFTLDSPDIQGLIAELRYLKQAGFNTIILRVFKNPYDGAFRFVRETGSSGVYFNSRQEPVVADALTPVIKAAHSLDIRVFAWITTRKSQWILSERPDWDSSDLNLETGQRSPGGHLDVFRMDVQKRLMEMLAELSMTGVDGILLQDDLVSRQAQDFSSAAWRDYSGSTFQDRHLTTLFYPGPQVKYKPDFFTWTRYKSKALAQIIQRFIRHVKSRRPDIKIAVNLYYETVLAPQHGRLWLSQDLEEMVSEPIDFWAIMAYQKQISQELNLTEKQIAERLVQARKYLTESLLIPDSALLWKLQLQDWKSNELVPVQDWSRLLESFSPNQYVLVPYRGRWSMQHFTASLNASQ